MAKVIIGNQQPDYYSLIKSALSEVHIREVDISAMFIVYIEDDTRHFDMKVEARPSRGDLSNSAKFSESSVFGQEGYLK